MPAMPMMLLNVFMDLAAIFLTFDFKWKRRSAVYQVKNSREQSSSNKMGEKSSDGGDEKDERAGNGDATGSKAEQDRNQQQQGGEQQQQEQDAETQDKEEQSRLASAASVLQKRYRWVGDVPSCDASTDSPACSEDTGPIERHLA